MEEIPVILMPAPYIKKLPGLKPQVLNFTAGDGCISSINSSIYLKSLLITLICKS